MNINGDNARAFIVLLATAGLPALVALGILHWSGSTLGIVDATWTTLTTGFFRVFQASPKVG